MSNTEKSKNSKTKELDGTSPTTSSVPTSPKELTIDESLAIINEQADKVVELVKEHLKMCSKLNKPVARFIRFQQVFSQLRKNCIVK